MSNNLTLGDGQLATTATAVYTGSNFDPTRINLICQNTSASLTETVTITFTRNGGTARRVARAVLAPNQQLVIKGLPVATGDVVLGATTDATTVDYLVTVGGSSDYSVTVLDANGSIKEATTSSSYTSTGGINSSGPTGAGIGYVTGAGGAVTQLTNRSTGVTLSKLSGQITTDSTSLAAGAEASFTVTNTTVAATDTIVLTITPGGTGTPSAYVSTVADGSFQITLTNLHASTADTSADVINFAVFKAVAA